MPFLSRSPKLMAIQPRFVRGPSVLPVVYRLWTSLRLGRLREWVESGCLNQFLVFDGLSSVEAWFSLLWTLRRFCPGTSSRLGLLGWFRRTYFACHSQVRLWFKLLLVLVSLGVGMGYPTGLSFEHGLLLLLFMSLRVGTSSL